MERLAGLVMHLERLNSCFRMDHSRRDNLNDIRSAPLLISLRQTNVYNRFIMPNREISDLLEQLFRQAQMQFGSAIKSRWFYDRDGCPGCGREISTMKWKKKNAISLNAFIYREHGVLIGYLLCGKCARQVIAATQNLPLHADIEKNLKKAFLSHLGH